MEVSSDGFDTALVISCCRPSSIIVAGGEAVVARLLTISVSEDLALAWAFFELHLELLVSL